MRLHMGKALEAQKIIQGRRKLQTVILAGTTSAQTMGRWAKSMEILIQGIKYTFTFDGAEDTQPLNLAKRTGH